MVTIGLVYMIIVILFGSLLVPFVILFPLIGLLMLIMLTGIVATNVIMLRDLMVVTNATVLRDFAVVTNVTVLLNLTQHKIEAGADVRTALMQGGRTHVRPMLMTAAATILALIPLALSTAAGSSRPACFALGRGRSPRKEVSTWVVYHYTPQRTSPVRTP